MLLERFGRGSLDGFHPEASYRNVKLKPSLDLVTLVGAAGSDWSYFHPNSFEQKPDRLSKGARDGGRTFRYVASMNSKSNSNESTKQEIMNPMNEVQDKVAIVTGAASGIGRA